MEEKSYPFHVITTEYKYEFFSISETKRVKKIVLFTKVSNENVYNLALLDELLENGEFSDSSETNNNDLKTILSTIVHIIVDFLNKNPSVIIIFRGNEKRRQRLYRIVIDREIDKISKKFRIFGSLNDEIFPFQSNQNYEYYLITKI